MSEMPGSFIVKDTNRDGKTVTIIRDPHGSIMYPSYVPPEVKRPISANPPPADVTGPKSDSNPPQPRRSQTAFSKPSRSDGLPSLRPRSRIKFGSELPRSKAWNPRSRPALHAPGGKKRGATQLNKALQEPRRKDNISDCSSCSSSSSDESDDRHRDDEAGDRQLDRGVSEKEGKLYRQDKEEAYRRFRVGNSNYHTKGKVSGKDGRLRITVKDTSNTGYLAKAVGSAMRKVVPGVGADNEIPTKSRGLSVGSVTSTVTDLGQKPRLNIVIMVIGSRGDAQPFLKIGKLLKEQYGHRVRIATHPAFREFVEKDTGLEFFSVGGDPSELMAFMVKNPGMIPTLESVKAGDIGRRRAAMAEMFEGFWRACVNATDDEKDMQNIKMMGDKDPFVADAIIANPPSFAHIHCAEALGIPLHLMFTFPYTPTQKFPHPLASIKKSNVDPGYTNFMSYPLVEMMVWQGLGDLVNDFRVKRLGLDPVSTLWAPGATYRLHVPFTYLWSPGLVSKPEDWGPEVDVSGFVFLDLASSFTPPSDLSSFLDQCEEPPIYIGFGSIVVDDPDKFTEMIFEAVKQVGCRALVSKGWGGLGGMAANPPENIFMLDNTPHDWLFPKVGAPVIHGGAGTTAIALKCGKPIMVVPFFGDQYFWGIMTSASGVGPDPVPYKSLTAEKLAEGIRFLLADEAKHAAHDIARDIEAEGDGAENAVRSFQQHLKTGGMACSILEDRVAAWRAKGTNIKLSALAADVAVEKGLTTWRKLRLLRHREWNDFEGPGEPVTGIAGSIVGTVGNIFGGIGGVPYRLVKSGKRRRNQTERQRKGGLERSKRKQGKKKTKEDEKINDAAGGTNEDSKGLTQKARPTTPKDVNACFERPETADEVLTHVGKGVSQSAAALALAPVDLSMALAQGFHNAPRLYGDDTVRRPPRVTGMHSGLKAAGAEFIYGIYDGWTGVVKHPVRGAKENGIKGCAKGVGIGLTGFVLKDIAAIIGPFGYTLKGVVKQVERGRGPIRCVRRARISQGGREWNKLDSSVAYRRVSLHGSRDDKDDAISEQLRKEIVNRVIDGWEILKKLENTIRAKEKHAGKHSWLRSRKCKIEGVDITVGVEEAEKALKELENGKSVDELFSQGARRGGLLE